jgi:hypothetical protein
MDSAKAVNSNWSIRQEALDERISDFNKNKAHA